MTPIVTPIVTPAVTPIGLVILISGRGTNAMAIAEAIDDGRVPARLHAVIADRDADGLRSMASHGADTACVTRDAFNNRAGFESALADVIENYHPDLIALAGFMRVLSTDFVDRFSGRMINIHPSLLPAYRGLDTHARALADGATEHGASVHRVTPELDGGPVIAQARLNIEPGEAPERLAARVLEHEHRLYPATLALLARGEVSLIDGHDPHPSPLVLDRDFDDAGRRRSSPGQ